MDSVEYQIDAAHNAVGMMEREKAAAEEKMQQAKQLVEKELQLQNEKLKHEAKASLDAELERLKEEHPVMEQRKLLESLNTQIAEARRILTTHQAVIKAAEEKEDFDAAHSLKLTPVDQADINLLRRFAPQIARKDAISKLIWTEWYQRPLQALRKSLDADKKIGIYMIEEKSTGRMYIGQAMNIGERWAEHVKVALGIGSNAYQTNKFYKAMHEQGPENFTFRILELCEFTMLTPREKYWIDFYNAVSFGFNTKVGG